MSRSPRRGLSLTEVLVVLAMIGILIGFLLPAQRRVSEASNRTRCANNLRQIMLGLHGFEATGRPAAYSPGGDPDSPDEHLFPPGCFGPVTVPEERLSWMAALLPYMEQDALYRQLNFEQGYAGNLPVVETRINRYLCPSSTEEGTPAKAETHYIAMSGIGPDAARQPVGASGNGFMGYDRWTSAAMITDGTANTIALMETKADLGPWARGGPATVRGLDPTGAALLGDHPPFGGRHPGGGMRVAMADGRVQLLPPSIDPKILAALITVAGGEEIPSDWR